MQSREGDFPTPHLSSPSGGLRSFPRDPFRTDFQKKRPPFSSSLTQQLQRKVFQFCTPVLFAKRRPKENASHFAPFFSLQCLMAVRLDSACISPNVEEEKVLFNFSIKINYSWFSCGGRGARGAVYVYRIFGSIAKIVPALHRYFFRRTKHFRGEKMKARKSS